MQHLVKNWNTHFLTCLLCFFCFLAFHLNNFFKDKTAFLRSLNLQWEAALEDTEKKLLEETQKAAQDKDLLEMKTWGLEHAAQQKLKNYLIPGVLSQVVLLDSQCQIVASSEEKLADTTSWCALIEKKSTQLWSKDSLTVFQPLNQGGKLFLVSRVLFQDEWLNRDAHLKSFFSENQISFSKEPDSTKIPLKHIDVYGRAWWFDFLPQFLVSHPDMSLDGWMGFLFLMALISALLDMFSFIKQRRSSEEVEGQLAQKSKDYDALWQDYQKTKKDQENFQIKSESLTYQMKHLQCLKQKEQRWDILAESVEKDTDGFLSLLSAQVWQLQSLGELIKNHLLQKIQHIHESTLSLSHVPMRQREDILPHLLNDTAEMIDEWIQVALTLDQMKERQSSLGGTIRHWKDLAKNERPAEHLSVKPIDYYPSPLP